MKNFGYVVALILIIAMVIALVCAWTKKQISTLSERLLVAEREIETEYQNLKLAKAVKEYLDREIGLLLIGIKLAFCLLLSLIWILLFRSEQDLMNSLFDVFDLMGIIYLSVCYLLFNEFTEPNKLVSILKKQLQVWVYTRSKFDPKRIVEIENRILQKQNEAEQLRNQLNLGT